MHVQRAPATDVLVRGETLGLEFDGGTVHALAGVDIEIRAGEFVALSGPSGCGKSSVLNLVGALDAPSTGRLSFRGQPYDSLGDLSLFRRRHIGFIFQSFHLIPTLTALENVLVPTLGHGGSARGHATRATQLLERIGLGARLGHLPGALSGGERQRVAIARSLINEPGLILADEPTGALDSVSACEVLDLIGGLRKDREVTVLMVSHDAAVCARADRIVRMRDGRVVMGPEPALA